MSMEVNDTDVEIMYNALEQLKEEVGLDYAQSIVEDNLYNYIHRNDFEKLNYRY